MSDNWNFGLGVLLTIRQLSERLEILVRMIPLSLFRRIRARKTKERTSSKEQNCNFCLIVKTPFLL